MLSGVFLLLQGDQVEFESETRSISQKFQNLRDEMVLQYGYEGFKPPPGGGANSTQEQFDIRTKMQCDSKFPDPVCRSTNDCSRKELSNNVRSERVRTNCVCVRPGERRRAAMCRLVRQQVEGVHGGDSCPRHQPHPMCLHEVPLPV